MKLSEFEQALRIDRHDLDNELVKQPELFWKISEASVLARSRVDEAKTYLDLLEAELDKKLREDHADEKVTEKTIAMELVRDVERVAAYRDYLKKKRTCDSLEQMREAYRQRGYVLRELASLYIAGYYQDASVGSGHAKVREARAEYNKERMAEKRRAR